MAPRLLSLSLAVAFSWALLPAALSIERGFLRLQEEVDYRGSRNAARRSSRILSEEITDVDAEEKIVIRDGNLFQTEGCPQVVTAEEALTRVADDSTPGNVITLVSDGPGRAGNHFLTISAYFAMAYCCKTKVVSLFERCKIAAHGAPASAVNSMWCKLTLPRYDGTFPSEGDGGFASEKRFFDFSGVDTMPLEEYDGLFEDPLVCEPEFKQGGIDAFYLADIHSDLLSCMNRVYLRGCEAAYLEPLLGAEHYHYCPKPTAAHDRRLSDGKGGDDADGQAPSLVNRRSVVSREESESLAATARASAEAASPSTGARPSGLSSDDRGHDRLHVAGATDSVAKGGESDHDGDGERSTNTRATTAVHVPALDGRSRLRVTEDGTVHSMADHGRRLSKESPQLDESISKHFGLMRGIGERGSAGSLVIHIRSGDIFLKEMLKWMKSDFLGFGQPPLQFYLRAIASQPWSDVTILTFSSADENLNPTFVALEMMQQAGMLGPNVTAHRDRDLLTDIRSMLCADGLAISRSTLHFLTFGHTRAKHLFIPSECGPGTYTRRTRTKRDGTKKPNPNNTTLLCLEKPDIEVYGVEWEVDEDDYFLYKGWEATDAQRLEMVLFDGIKGLSRCCAN